jgi:hypothetical protein
MEVQQTLQLMNQLMRIPDTSRKQSTRRAEDVDIIPFHDI